MFMNECLICRINSQVNSYELSLRNIERNLDVLLKEISKDFKEKENISLESFKLKATGICRNRCLKNNDFLFKNHQNIVFNKLNKVLSYQKETKKLNLQNLKNSCRGNYFRLYQYINRI